MSVIAMLLTGCSGPLPREDEPPIAAPTALTIPRLGNESWPEIAGIVRNMTEEFRGIHLKDAERQAQFERFAFEGENDLARGWPNEATWALFLAWNHVYEDTWIAEGANFTEVAEANEREEERLLELLRNAPTSSCNVLAGLRIHRGEAQHMGAMHTWEESGTPDWGNEGGFPGQLKVASALLDANCTPADHPRGVVEWVASELAKPPTSGASDYVQGKMNLSQWAADWATEHGLPGSTRQSALNSVLAWRLVARAENGDLPPPRADAVASIAQAAFATHPRDFNAASYAAGMNWVDNWQRTASFQPDPNALLMAYYWFALATGDPGAHWPPPAPGP